ncbi:DUF4192 domain-containing protein [Rhodococcus sp. SGAir0479]|uniref:DUF4192 domain-containing protein n=1 Tax=Rhodococcus sp. SGAir0479 TaxID=2567884 RepID=UPI0010CCD474|nr:DUF4192 domain-containing protein [Rhodococcus sp. SGAir0479]QCQ90810.1 DUF4192 domain-containing protein [Rhodococcus sp. SGAir0479]
MTTPASSHDSHFPPDASWDGAADRQSRVRISDPGALISSVPALLGFHPHRSLVAICLSGTRVGAVMRHDLVLGGGADGRVMDLVLEQFAAVAAREEADRMLAVMVDDRIPVRARDADLEPYAGVAARLRDALGRSAIALAAVHVCRRIETGAAWQDLTGTSRGTVPDPTASQVAAAQVIGGRAIRGSREELEAVIEPAPLREQARVAALVDRAREDGLREPTRSCAVADPLRADRVSLEGVLAEIARFESDDEPPSPHECARLALALEIPRVRDSLLALAAGSHAGAAEQLWIHLARVLPDPERAEPLSLLGYSAYVRGDGPMAGVALYAALAADPCHRLANLLDDALQAGLRPDLLRDLAVIGHQVAEEIGVQLPPLDPLSTGGV